MRTFYAALVFSFSAILSAPAAAEVFVTIVQGLGGQPQYDEQFTQQRERILTASHSLTAEDNVRVFHGEAATRENLLAHFDSLATYMGDNDRAILYLVGHGSFDGELYKFNIPGPDISTSDLEDILGSLPGARHVLVNTSSTSGALLEPLESDQYILVTATRSGNERNATEFGAFFAEALTSEEADLNKDEVISIQEAFDYANRQVEDFFESAGRLATEHPQLQGEGAGQFTLARLNTADLEETDPEIARLIQERSSVESDIEELQLRRDEYSTEEYNRRLRELVLESASLTEQIEQLRGESNGDLD